MMKTTFLAAALLAGAAAPAVAAATGDVLSYYSFVGSCVDCADTGVGRLTLRNYDPAVTAELAAENFVAFTYTSNLLGRVDVAAVSDLSGALDQPLGGPKQVAFEARDVDFRFQSLASGYWQINDAVGVADFGLAHAWNAASASDVPEPAGWALMLAGFALTGAALRGRRPAAVRFA